MKFLMSLFLGLLFATGLLHAEVQKVVYDVSTGDAAVLEKRLIGSVESLMADAQERKTEYKIAVVISGKSYKYFVKDLKNSPYSGKLKVARAQKRLEPLLEKLHKKYGVVFTMCSVGMKAHKIKEETLYGFVEAKRSKSVYLVQWQNRGYAYMPVH